MTYKDFYTLLGEAINSADLDMYIAECGTSVIFDQDPDGEAPDYNAVVADLTNIWNLAHMSIKDIIKAADLNQSDLTRRFYIPLRTVQHWVAGTRACPVYTKIMIADLLGLITVERT